MNERYLFRAWLPELKQMVYPTAIRYVEKGIAIEYRNENGERCLDGPGWFELMQCTGLRDDNDELIFEGDILLLHPTGEEARHAVVMFGNPNGVYSWGWQLDFIGEPKPNYFNPDILLWVQTELPGMTCEITGNIHDREEAGTDVK